MKNKPKLAVFKFASCDGCQLSLLDCEDELLAVTGEIEIAHFLEASRRVLDGPYDLTLVEGSITTPHDARRIQEIRKISKTLVTICAFLQGRKPQMPTSSVCLECKRRGTVCVMVAHQTPCLGPVTQDGCGAICPEMGSAHIQTPFSS